MKKRVGIIGGGIAGVSAAYFLAQELGGHDVVLVEAEQQLAHHTTGRSAAILLENYGAAPIRSLTAAGLAFLQTPPAELVDSPILTTRGTLFVASAAEEVDLEHMLDESRSAGGDLVELTMAEAHEVCPVLKPGVHTRALMESHSSDIDVAGLHQSFVRGFRNAGGTIQTSTRIDDISKTTGGWRLGSTQEPITVDVVVNAAGAWGDRVATEAGIKPVGLMPMRRTAFMVSSQVSGSEHWPMFTNAGHTWYVKPDGAQFLCSPADEHPNEPCDVKPEELDVAIAIDRINSETTLNIRSVTSQWAGLRSFVADRSMVLGPDPDDETFVWLVGQGGTGIQTSPGTGQLTADLIAHGAPGSSFDQVGLDIAGLLVDRLRD